MIQTKHTLKTKRVTGKIGPAVQKKEKGGNNTKQPGSGVIDTHSP